jgi:hypothetical protein
MSYKKTSRHAEVEDRRYPRSSERGGIKKNERKRDSNDFRPTTGIPPTYFSTSGNEDV